MCVHYGEGSMPAGGTYEEFAELLARFYRTFEPLKGRGGEDERDFLTIRAVLEMFAARHSVAPPQELLNQQDRLEGYATPFDVLEHLSAIVRDFGLCHPQGDLDDQYHATLGRTILKILHRYRAIDAAFDADGDGRMVAFGVIRWIVFDSMPMEKVLDPQRQEGSIACHKS